MSCSEDEAEFDGGDVQQVSAPEEQQQAATFEGVPPPGPAESGSNADEVESGSASSSSRKSSKSKKGKTSTKAKKTKATKKAVPNKKQKTSAKAKKPSEKGKATKKGATTKKATAKVNGKSNGKKAGKSAAEPPANASLDLLTKHFREFERGLARLEKVDQFGFFLDPAPTEFDENYDNPNSDEVGDTDSGSSSTPAYPCHAPFNWEMVRRRHAQGRYILDIQERDEERLEQIASFLKEERGEEATHELPSTVAILHGQGVNWDLFRKDVYEMCDSSLERNPDDIGDGKAGSRLHAVKKIKGVSLCFCQDSVNSLKGNANRNFFIFTGAGYNLR